MNRPTSRSRILIFFVIFLIAFSSGYSLNEYNHIESAQDIPSVSQDATNGGLQSHEASPEQLLRLSAKVVQDSNYFTTANTKESGGSEELTIIYTGLKEVTIHLSGNTTRLEDAIRDGKISLAEIFAYARIDAQNGFCTELYLSKNGLSTFIYAYPDLNVRLVYDIYETPDGEQHLISDLAVYRSDLNPKRLYTDSTGQPLDQEDWGLDFEVVQVSPDAVTIEYTQEYGQHFGELLAESYYIIANVNGKPQRLSSSMDTDALYYPMPCTVLKKGTSGKFIINWSDVYGKLANGTYKLCLQIRDVYHAQDVHPFTRNYYDAQSYVIYFSIP